MLLLPTSRISTHTLTWSVTGGIAGCGETLCNFNSHAHVERDPVTIVIHFLIKISTHTLTWSVTVILAVLSDI